MEFDAREEDNDVDSNDDSEDEEAPPPRTHSMAVQKHSKNNTQQYFNVDTIPRNNNSNHDEIPRTRSWSQYDLLEDISSESESIRPDKSRSYSPEKSYSVAPTALSPASSHFAAEADIESIRSLETEYHSLLRAIQSHPRHSPIWQMLNSYLERAREELDAITEDIEVHPHTIHIMAPSCNLGLVVDKRPDGGPVYIRSLHPLSPLRDQVQLKDKIIAIDGVDVRQSSPVEVGELLSGITTKEVRKITIARHDVLVGYGSGLNYARDRSSPTRSGVGLNERHSNKSLISALTEDSPQHDANRFTYQSSANAMEPRTIDNTTTIHTSKSEDDPNGRAVKLVSDIKHFIRKLDDEMAQASLTDGKVSYGPMVQAKDDPHRMLSVKSSRDKSLGGSTKDPWCSMKRERNVVREICSGHVKELDKGNKDPVRVPMRARSEEVKKDKSRYAQFRRVNSDQSAVIKEEIKAAKEISAHIEELD
eukprot:CAMPEP_0201646090 /NCGR_PEP_ID=MMETSP0493-20130528/33314_1 /ASSEMBLY_ACC=CAM_ASM_000838 /TAXON_ID=420259 /ORGANISM="Thalassiosira gravida, Strain GMp14c1" /LENGTH=476 /DNA_ID=CAMNT_0048121177 /DNA_START=263 /DNA_END=1693 /DNA_ORIENTATION=-